MSETAKAKFDRKAYQRERYHRLKAQKAQVPTQVPQYSGETPAEQAFERIVAEAPVVQMSERPL